MVAGENKSSTPPNVILVCVDQWRGDCLSGAGHPVVETPYLDQLALNGVRFNRAYTATPSCVPARATLMTGLNQHHTGRIGYQDGLPWDYPVTLAGEFTRNGYQTEAIGKFHAFPERSQLGFQHVQLHDGFLHFSRGRNSALSNNDDYLEWLQREAGHGVDYFDHGLNCNGITVRPWDKEERLHPTNWIVSQAVDFLPRRDPRKPFFLYLGFHRPHPPYDPPQWAFGQYQRRTMPDPVIGDWEEMLEPWANDALHEATVARYPRHLTDRAKAGYYGHMTHIDHQLNRFFEALKGHDLADNTWICFVSDHGESMGDHNLYRKSLPYEGSARVPFIISGPEGQVPHGTTSNAVMELQDVMPTLLDCASLPVPDGLDGRSVLPVARGEAHEVRSWVHGEHSALGQTVQWLTDGHVKYVWWSAEGVEQFFDLDTDPQERHDLAKVSARTNDIALWRSRLIAQLDGREDGHAADGVLISGQPARSTLPSVIERWAAGVSA